MAASPEPKEIHMGKVILITGSSSGFGRMACNALALAGHTVYASMRETKGRNAQQVGEVESFARDRRVDLRPLELDVASEASAEAAIAAIVAEMGRLDVVVHNAGHMVFGPTEAFTPDQLAEIYDVNVLSTQRVNRAALPTMRRQRQGLLVWVGSSSSRGGTPPYLAPYFAAKSGMDQLAVSYATELARWGIETSIIVPGSFTHGTNHFAHAGKPADEARAAEYAEAPGGDLGPTALKNLAAIAPLEADPEEVGRQIVRVVDLPAGKRPFRVHIDPADDGAGVVNMVADRMRAEFLNRIGLGDTLTVHSS
jgi:NAD(P)-dependent dehydrogenase (short-subunit alcohol dehydrogenase family)